MVLYYLGRSGSTSAAVYYYDDDDYMMLVGKGKSNESIKKRKTTKQKTIYINIHIEQKKT